MLRRPKSQDIWPPAPPKSRWSCRSWLGACSARRNFASITRNVNMRCEYACRSADHQLARRQFLGAAAAGLGAIAGGLGALASPAAAAELAKDQKRVVVFNMHGGLSQLESWDPKPATNTGGPFRAIPTSVPG